MDRKKPPALTSPWKVGFLVALMLVVTALGVGYFISGAFGLKWHWIEFGGASPATWTFRLGPFIDEMVPLLALVTLLAVASCVLVSGAVKRYTRFVDSGVDYRQLLKSIKTIDDLEDEERLEQLKQHPELREFLLGFKNRMAARERQMSERDKRPAARESDAPARNLPAECGRLVSAITNGKSGFSGELALTIPELKQIERAVREQFSRDAPAAEIDSLRSRVDTTLEAVRRHSAGIRRDADACVAGVREMETLLGQLTRAIQTPQESAVATDGITGAAKLLDAMADALASLGEETKRIAITAALEASGGGEGQSIKIADEMRTIATRFNAVAVQWKQAGPALRTGITTIEKGTSSSGQHRKSLAASAAKAAASAQKWGERLVALQEQVRELERAAGVQGNTAAPAREWGTIDTSFDDDNAGTTIEPNVPGADTGSDPGSEAAIAQASDTDDQFENVAREHVFEETEAPFADIPGFEKEQRVFNDRMAGAHAAAGRDALEVEQNAGDDYHAAAAPEPAHAAAPEAPAAAETPIADDGFLTGPRASTPREAPAPVAEPAPARRSRVRTAPVAVETEEDGRIDIDADLDVDADALDLYALGAVDFVEGVHV